MPVQEQAVEEVQQQVPTFELALLEQQHRAQCLQTAPPPFSPFRSVPWAFPVRQVVGPVHHRTTCTVTEPVQRRLVQRRLVQQERVLRVLVAD